MNELDNFKISLQETIQYCLRPKEHSDLAKAFRTVELVPSNQLYLETWPFEVDDYNVPVKGVIEARRKLLKEPIKNSCDLKGGRLLYYVPEAQLADGASEAETHGFFDTYDTPPWDTWIAYITTESKESFFVDREKYDTTYSISLLVSYVPEEFISLVQGGIDVNCMECFRWAEDFNCSFTQQLIKEKLIKSKN